MEFLDKNLTFRIVWLGKDCTKMRVNKGKEEEMMSKVESLTSSKTILQVSSVFNTNPADIH